jgi:hypothetical protein
VGWLVLVLAFCRCVAAPCPGLSLDVVPRPQAYGVYSADPAHVVDIHLTFALAWTLQEEEAIDEGGQDVESDPCSQLCKHQNAHVVLYDTGLRQGVVGYAELGEQSINVRRSAGHFNISLKWEGAGEGVVCAEAWEEVLVVATRLELVQAPWGTRAGQLLDIQPSVMLLLLAPAAPGARFALDDHSGATITATLFDGGADDANWEEEGGGGGVLLGQASCESVAWRAGGEADDPDEAPTGCVARFQLLAIPPGISGVSRAPGFGFGVLWSGCVVCGLAFGVWELGFSVSGSGLKVQGVRFKDSGV